MTNGSDRTGEGIPLEILREFCQQQATGQLQLFGEGVTWVVRLEFGKLTYATHTIDPSDRLMCQLRRMERQDPSLNKELRSQLQAKFNELEATESDDPSLRTSDYEALCWMVGQQHLSFAQAARAVEPLLQEALEPLLWLDTVRFRFVPRLGEPLTLCRLDLDPAISYCSDRLRLWQLLAPWIYSPYQRPYFFGKTSQQEQLLPELRLHERFSAVLKGYSFRHLAVLLHRDEIKVAGSLMPYICEEVIVLRDPQPPFNALPRVPDLLPASFARLERPASAPAASSPLPPAAIEAPPADIPPTKTYTIACIDDSPTVLREIERLLGHADFRVVAIADPLKAMLQILKSEPDIILLDVTMPKIDGYELCRLVRNNPKFKHTPIVMVTGNTGLIDRARAKLAGATDYLTKPFTEETLLRVVFRHLSRL